MFNLTIPNYYEVQDHLGYCIWCGKEILNIEDMKNNVDKGVKIILNKETKEMILYGNYGSCVYDYNVGYVNDRDFYDVIKNYQNKFKTNAYICDDCCNKYGKYNKIFITDNEPLDFNNLSNYTKELEKGYYSQIPKKGFAYFFNKKKDRERLLANIHNHPYLKLDELRPDYISFHYKDFSEETIIIKQNEVLINYNNLWTNVYRKENGEIEYVTNYEIMSEKEFKSRFAYRGF